MKKIFFAMLQPFTIIFQFVVILSKKLSKIFAVIAVYTYGASDLLIRNCLECYRTFIKNIKSRQIKFARYLSYQGLCRFAAALATILVFLYVVANCLFIVPVGSSAVITRFGAYVREVESGLNIIIPIAERYFIVNTGNLMEETFGFIQGPLQLTKERFNPQENFVTRHYETDILQSEQDAEQPFAEKGGFLQEINRRQRLTHDYIRQTYAPPLDKSQQGIIKRIQQKEKAILATTKKANLDVSGRIQTPAEMLYLTGDQGLIQIQWAVQFHIQDAKKYLFNSRDTEENIRNIAMAQMSEVVGETLFNEVMTSGRHAVEVNVLKKTQKILDQYGVGIELSQVIILNALPTPEVVYAFDEVNRATQDAERFRFQGEVEYQRRIPKAYGEAKKIIAEGQAYAIKIVNQAEGEAGRFIAVKNEYEKAPQITEDRLYIVAMQEILRQTPTIILDQNAKGILPLFISSTGLAKTENPSGVTSQSLIDKWQGLANQIETHIKPQTSQPAPLKPITQRATNTTVPGLQAPGLAADQTLLNNTTPQMAP